MFISRQLGVKGYLSKDVEPYELNEAIHAIFNKGYYILTLLQGIDPWPKRG
jgi:two-component system, NarL family, invasion response regulator UvrY